MTVQSEMERETIEIDSAEDEPLSTNDNLSVDSDLSKEENTKQGLDLRRFRLGSNMLAWCLILMFVCIILSFWKPDNALLNNGFEAYKLIVMTILGYIFGSNSHSSEK